MDGKCSIYEDRPTACREFPLNQAEVDQCSSCSFWFDEEGNRHGECNHCAQCCDTLGMTFDGVYYEACPYRIK